MTQIIAFAGRKQSGKNACCNFLTMVKLAECGVCKRVKQDTKTGELLVSDVFGERNPDLEFMPFKKPHIDVDAVLNSTNVVKVYAIADSLKRIAIDVLGLDENKVYGTDDNKNELTHLRWENMPGVITQKLPIEFEEVNGRLGYYYAAGEYTAENGTHIPLVYHPEGPMTIRDVLKFVGTEVFRNMNPNIWIDTALRRIEKDRPEVALVCDARFDNEITMLKDKGGIVIGLLRDIFNSKDTHPTEQINFSLCTDVIDNTEMDMDEQNEALFSMLKSHGCKNIRSLER